MLSPISAAISTGLARSENFGEAVMLQVSAVRAARFSRLSEAVGSKNFGLKFGSAFTYVSLNKDHCLLIDSMGKVIRGSNNILNSKEHLTNNECLADVLHKEARIAIATQGRFS